MKKRIKDLKEKIKELNKKNRFQYDTEDRLVIWKFKMTKTF